MKNRNISIGLCLTILVAFGAGNALAATSPDNPGHAKNPQNKGLKTPHSSRKEAAKRLKPVYQQEHQQKLQDWANAHHGYTGQGQAGQSAGSNQKSVSNRGVK
jgi:hypothetical protein